MASMAEFRHSGRAVRGPHQARVGTNKESDHDPIEDCIPGFRRRGRHCAPVALAGGLPGEGKTVRYARNDSLGANYVMSEIIISALKELGYDVDVRTVGVPAYFQAASQGDMDMAAGVNYPQREIQYLTVQETVALVGEGAIGNGGGINGYMVNKSVAEELGLKNIQDLKDPEIAKVFDTDGDGLANLHNCDPGWSCGDVVDFQLKEFGLSETVESVRAKYEPLMAEVFARYRQGEPVLFYTWSPSFVTQELKPGEDMVWLPIPYGAVPEAVKVKSHEVHGVVGCAADQDPCLMATGSWNWQVTANREFLKENPAVERLGELVQWPLATWSAWEGEMKADTSDRNVRRIAESWISDNREQFDRWVAEAKSAAM